MCLYSKSPGWGEWGGVSKVYYGLCENVIMGNDGETNLGACNIIGLRLGKIKHNKT